MTEVLRKHPLALSIKHFFDFLIFTEPVWALPILIFTYIFLFLGLYDYVYPGLIISTFPLFLNYLRYGKLSQPTAFDVPVFLFLISALVAVVISNQPALSFGAFTSCVLMTLFYYSVVNYPHTKSWPFWILIYLVLVPVFALVITRVFWQPFTSFMADLGAVVNLSVHKPAESSFSLILFIVALPLLGLVIREKNILFRLTLVFATFGLTAASYLIKQDALLRVITGVSLKNRLTVWEKALSLVREKPLTGVGFGHLPGLHNAYLELYTNTGILGVLAAFIAIIISVRLMWDILCSKYKPLWTGFGLGLFFVVVYVALLAVLESSPFGFFVQMEYSYYYVVSPIPWLIASLLVVTHRMLTQKPSP